MKYTPHPPLGRGRLDSVSALGVAATGFAAALILVIIATILGSIALQGLPALSWHFVSSIPKRDFFDRDSAAVLPMIIGTTLRVLVMTVFVMPVGVVTAVYLSEYARPESPVTRMIRSAINNLAGVPSIVFGLFGLGFFINFVGRGLDDVTGVTAARLGKPSILWASLTLAVMTLPVVIVSTEESLRAIPRGLREGGIALGASRLQTVMRLVLPNALPGILTGGILAISRAAGEVAPILFTGVAYFTPDLPRGLTDPFMDLGFHTYVLATQSPNIERTRPILYATVLVLLMLTFTLNAVAIVVRARTRQALRPSH